MIASQEARAAYLAQVRADLAAMPVEHRAQLDDRYDRVKAGYMGRRLAVASAAQRRAHRRLRVEQGCRPPAGSMPSSFA